MPEPKLPVIDYKACPGASRSLPQTKIVRNDNVYSTWKYKRVPLATLRAGDELTVLAGLNVIREPDTAVFKQSRPDL